MQNSVRKVFLCEVEVAEGDPMELGDGGDVCNVPTEPEFVEVVPGDDVVVPGAVEVVPCDVEVTPVWVDVVPGCVDVVPWGEDVVVCGPIPGLGVTEPVLCAEARPTDSANTDEANRIFRMNLLLLNLSLRLCLAAGEYTFSLNRLVMG